MYAFRLVSFRLGLNKVFFLLFFSMLIVVLLLLQNITTRKNETNLPDLVDKRDEGGLLRHQD